MVRYQAWQVPVDQGDVWLAALQGIRQVGRIGALADDLHTGLV
jgi:hypothetical protein